MKKYLILANGIPSADTILRVLARIDTGQLGKAFIEYAKFVFGNRIREGDVVRCHRTEKKTGKESLETRFFITSLTDAGKACRQCALTGV